MCFIIITFHLLFTAKQSGTFYLYLFYQCFIPEGIPLGTFYAPALTGTCCSLGLLHNWDPATPLWYPLGLYLSCVEFLLSWISCLLLQLWWSFPGGSVVKKCPCRRCRFNPWVGKIPWRRKWQPTPVFLPRKSHGQRSLVGNSS